MRPMNPKRGDRSEEGKRYYQKYHDQVRARQKERRSTKEYKEWFTNYFRGYRRKNAVKINEYNRVWAAAHPEKMREINKKQCVRQRQYKLNWNHGRRAKERLGAVSDCTRRMKELRKEKFCYWCASPISGKDNHVDHITPIARGGLHCPENLVASCRKCNQQKGKKLYWEWDEELAA